MRRIAAAALGALLALAGPADGRQHFPARGHRILQGGAPLDSFAQPSGAYSFRKLKSTYAGPAVRIRRASDNLETDINFLGFTGFTGAPWDEAAANAHCAATSCFLRWWYDQSGAARDLGQATAANQPALIFNCNGALPCLRMTASTQTLISAAYTPPSGLQSMSVVAKRAAGSPACYFLRTASTGNRINASGTANLWSLSDGTLFTSPAATDSVWHSAVGVIQATSSPVSALTIDGVTNSAPMNGSVTAGALSILGPASGSCDEAEAIYWPAYGLTPAEVAALGANQKSFWGTP